MAPNPNELLSYDTLVHAVAGAVGSVVGMTVFFPLDTVRSRLQLEERRQPKNTFTTIKELIKEEGFWTLYRGVVPVLESLCASNFVYFYTFHGLKALHAVTAQSASKDLLLASVAGIVNVLTTTPLWVVNTRLKMAGLQSANRQLSYSGLLDGLFEIGRAEGVSALWSGALPSLLLVANPALQLATYESIKRRLARRGELNAASYFLVGAVAKAVATTLTYPLQLIQTKMRHGHSFRDLSPDAGILQLTLYILKKKGLMGLYKGMEAKLLQTVLTAALMFMVYEKIARVVFRLLASNRLRF